MKQEPMTGSVYDVWAVYKIWFISGLVGSAAATILCNVVLAAASGTRSAIVSVVLAVVFSSILGTFLHYRCYALLLPTFRPSVPHPRTWITVESVLSFIFTLAIMTRHFAEAMSFAHSPDAAMRLAVWGAGAGSIIGLILGIVQGILLQRMFYGSGWWIGASVIGWAIGGSVFASMPYLYDAAVSGPLFITSMFLGWVLRSSIIGTAWGGLVFKLPHSTSG